MAPAQWMKSNRIKYAEIAERAGVTGVTVSRTMAGTAHNIKVIDTVIEMSKGAVTAQDFFDIRQAVA